MRRDLDDDGERAGATEPYRDAALYDWEYRRRRDDVAFYRMLAAERGGPVLDLACGSGRVLVALLADGHQVVGIDRSAPMLARAAARLRRLPPAMARRALLIRGDMRAFAFRGRFALCIAAFHSVQHLYEDRDLLLFFRNVRRALVPGGWFAFDVFAPDPRWLARPAHRWFDRTVFRHPVSRRMIAYSVSHTLDPARRVLHMRFGYQPLGRDGRAAGRRRIVRLSHRQLSPREVSALLRRADLQLCRAWAGWSGQELGWQTRAAPGAARSAKSPALDDGGREQHVYLARSPSENPGFASGISLDSPGPPDTMPSVFPLTSRRRAAEMAEKVAKLGVNREKDFMYYVKDGAVWKVQRKQPGVPKGKSEKVADGGFEMDTNFIYFVDKDGDVSRAKRAVGGQKRKKSAAKRGRAKAKKAPKKAAKKKGKAKKAAKGKKAKGKKKKR